MKASEIFALVMGIAIYSLILAVFLRGALVKYATHQTTFRTALMVSLFATGVFFALLYCLSFVGDRGDMGTNIVKTVAMAPVCFILYFCLVQGFFRLPLVATFKVTFFVLLIGTITIVGLGVFCSSSTRMFFDPQRSPY